MKIALIQINPIIGDFQFNTERLLWWIRRAKDAGCGLAVFPELAVSGYPPLDLLERPSFVADQETALIHFAEKIHGIAVICGAFTRNRSGMGKPLRNAAVFMDNGVIRGEIHKRLLPTYDVFDETRYFEPGDPATECLEFSNLRLGVTICEDIWNDPDVFPNRLYMRNPAADFFSSRTPPDIIINIAASPFHMGKSKIKEDIFRTLCTKYKTPLLYVNQVGGQDSLVFDGMSIAMRAHGAILAMARKFEEDCLVVDSDALFSTSMGKDHHTKPGNDDLPDVLAALVTGVRDYTAKCGFGKAILGLSGGIDSALTAVIACKALGAENVLGVALPSAYSSPASEEDARELARNLGMEFRVLPIAGIFDAMRHSLSPHFEHYPEDVTEQNLQARIRGNLLMALSNKFGALLLSTGNKSEMAVGYCTLYGDMSGGLAVISDVPKMLVYQLADHVNAEREIIPRRTLTKPPSAELAPDQKDEDDLPPYSVLDPILAAYLEEQKSIADIMAMGFKKETVMDVVRRVKKNEYKRKQASMGLKVTTKAFGFGRRYPTAENYREW